MHSCKFSPGARSVSDLHLLPKGHTEIQHANSQSNEHRSDKGEFDRAHPFNRRQKPNYSKTVPSKYSGVIVPSAHGFLPHSPTCLPVNHSTSAGGNCGSDIPEPVQLFPKLELPVKVTVSATNCVQPVVVDAPPANSIC